MDLILSITSFHKFTPELKSVYTLSSEEEYCSIKFGRSDSCDWVLPDPERIISGVHGEVSKFGNDYLLRDLSTNGIFINKSVSPIGSGMEITLNDNDTINFGDYEIEVTLSDTNKKTDDVLPNHNLMTTSFNTLSPREILNKPVDMPKMGDMDFGFDANLFLSQEEEIPRVLEKPDIGDIDDFFDTKSIENIEDFSIEKKEKTKKLLQRPMVEETSGFQPESETLLRAFLSGAGIDESLLPDNKKEVWFQELGKSYALMLDGLMQTLHNRTKFKQSNKLNHTAFQKRENNPLKFSADFDDAIHNLYNRKSSSFLSPEAAIKSAFRDIECHEKAMINGLHGAVSSVMKLLDPNHIAENISQYERSLFSTLFSKVDKKKWQKYEAFYYQLNNDFEVGGFDSDKFYLEDFAREYDKAIRNIEG